MKGKQGFNVKALFTNHIEKLGFGLIALIVLGVWATEFLGGSWSRTKISPDAMLQDIDKKRKEIDSSFWPAEKKADYELVDFSERAATLLRPIDSSRYELSTEFFVPLNRPKEKAREPEFLAVESLHALPGQVILALVPEEEPLEEGEEGEMAEEPEEEEPDEFQRRDQAIGAAAGVDEMDEIAAIKAPRNKTNRKNGLIAAPGAQPTGGDALAGQFKADKSLGGRGGRDYRTIGGQKPQGRFFVAVRGVWPVWQQKARIQKALHLPTVTAAEDFLDVLNFELERQEASAGDDPWTKPWEKLNIMYAKQILDEVDGFDDEPLDMAVFDTVMTMPLPMRMFGVWKDHATHPRIKNYELSPEERQREKAWQARIMEEYEKMELEAEKARGPKKEGFNTQSNDFRVIVNDMNRRNPRATGEAMRQMSQEMRMGVPGGAAMTADALNAKITAVGKLLLFRYFDFDVKPGYAYRYRVKLKLLNPNHDRPVSEVVDQSVADGEFRWTPESNTSIPAVLPVSPVYFLKDVEKNPLADEGRIRRTVATVSIYEWHKQMGTQVYDTLSLNSLGQFLGGKSKPMVLDVAVPSLEEDDYVFSTEDLLVDVTGDAELLPEDHPNLILPEKRKGSKVVALGLAPEAVVIGGGGDLRTLEANGESDAERALRKLADRERKQFKDVPKRADVDANPLDMMPGKAAKGGKGEAGAGPNAREGMANPRRKGGRSAAAAAMPAGAGFGIGAGEGGRLPPGMTAAGAPKAKGKAKSKNAK